MAKAGDADALNARALWGTRTPSPSAALIAFALAGLVLALVSAAWISHRNAASAGERFEVAAGRLAARVQSRLGLYEYGLRGMRGAVIAMGEANLSGLAIRRYAQSRDFEREFPGARGFGFIQRVGPDSESAFLAAARIETPEFQIRQLGPSPGERFVIRYVEPLERNREAIGLDVASEPGRRAAAIKAMETGAAAMSDPITLVQVPGKIERGFLVFLPVLAPNRMVATPEERRSATIGWSYAPLVIDEVLAGLDLETEELDFTLRDTAIAGSYAFFQTAGVGKSAPIGPTTRRLVPVFDRTWEIGVQARPAFLRGLDRPSPAVVGAVAMLLTLLGGSLASLHLAGRRRQILAAVQSDRLAAIVSNADEAILGKTLDGTITDWNPAAERLFGYAASEAIGRKAADLIFPRHLWDEESETLAAVVRGESVPSRATLRMRRDGTLLHVLVGVSPIKAPSGAIVGAATLMRDIGEQIAGEERVRALNESLERQVAERTEALRAAAAIQAAILQHAAYAIIATDVDGRITVFNPAAERMLGYAASDVIGQTTPMLFHDAAELDERTRRFSAEFGETIAPGPDTFLAPKRRGRPTIDEWTYLTKDGQRFPVLLSVSELRSDVGVALGYLGIAMDLTERDRHAAEMRAANAGTWSYDIATRRVRMSAECARQHGLADAETELDVETQWRALAHPDDVEHVLGDLASAIEVGGSYTTEFRVPLPGGTMRWLTAIGRVELEHATGRGRVMGLTLDVTARKEAEAALIEARQEAERANRVKRDFLAAMSHEIRTPLNAIIGYTGLMLSADRLCPEDRRQTELVRSAGSALLTVVNDILDFSRIEAGSVALHPRVFSLSELARTCISFVEVLAGSKNLSVRQAIDPDLPETLFGDEARLRQVLLNLLNNAVKFTREGSVELAIQSEGATVDGGRLRFTVTDTGIGVPDDKRDRLFKRFSQVDGSVEREYGGTGLGLAICKALVELMGGQIGAESELGVGSTFWFTVQLPRADTAIEASVPDRPLDGRTGRLLLVEDNRANQEIARAVLESAGHTVTVVADGKQAVATAGEGAFDVVLMDVQMPGLDGLSAARAIRDLSGSRGQVPIIGMSAGVLPDQIQRCRDAGMNDHVGKPFEPERLLSMIEHWLRSEEADATSSDLDVGQFAAVTHRIGEERLRLVLSLLDNELDRAFLDPGDSPKERERLRFEAHSLGSTAGTFGFLTMMRACRSLESFDEDRVASEGLSGFVTALDRVQDAVTALRAELRTRAEEGVP